MAKQPKQINYDRIMHNLYLPSFYRDAEVSNVDATKWCAVFGRQGFSLTLGVKLTGDLNHQLNVEVSCPCNAAGESLVKVQLQDHELKRVRLLFAYFRDKQFEEGQNRGSAMREEFFARANTMIEKEPA